MQQCVSGVNPRVVSRKRVCKIGGLKKDYYYYYYYYYHHHHHQHPLPSLHSSSAGSQNNAGLTHQALLILCCAKNFPSVLIIKANKMHYFSTLF